MLILFIMTSSVQSRVHIRRVGPDNRTEEQKQVDASEGMAFFVFVIIAIGGLVVWGKIRDS